MRLAILCEQDMYQSMYSECVLKVPYKSSSRSAFINEVMCTIQQGTAPPRILPIYGTHSIHVGSFTPGVTDRQTFNVRHLRLSYFSLPKGWYYSCYFNLANLASSGFFANISYRKYYKNDHIFAVKYNTSFTLYLK